MLALLYDSETWITNQKVDSKLQAIKNMPSEKNHKRKPVHRLTEVRHLTGQNDSDVKRGEER